MRHHTEQGNERKQQLLDAAQTLFADRGYRATRVADICRQAGVAKGLFYWYFPTKERLFAELVQITRLELRRAQAAAMNHADPDDVLDRIRRGTEASVHFIAEHRSFFTLLEVERTDPTVAALVDVGSEVYADDVRRLIVDGQRRGVIPDSDPQLATIGVLGIVSSFTHALRNGQIDDNVQQVATVAGQWVVAGLTTPVPTAPAGGVRQTS